MAESACKPEKGVFLQKKNKNYINKKNANVQENMLQNSDIMHYIKCTDEQWETTPKKAVYFT